MGASCNLNYLSLQQHGRKEKEGDFFDCKTFLTVSGQLHVEALARYSI